MTIQPPTCPTYFNYDFGRTLVEYLGGDPTLVNNNDCWPEFAKKFPHLLKPAMAYFESATTGEPARAAYYLARYCKADLTWAQTVIQNAQTGDPALAAYCLARHCKADLTWAQAVIQNAQTGNPAYAAYCLVRHCKADLNWYNLHFKQTP